MYILKQLFFSISVNSGFGNIYLAAFAARQIFSHYSPRFQRIIVNYADLGGRYPPRPSALVENTLLDLHNSSYLTQPHSLIAKSFAELHLIEDDVVFGLTIFP